MQYNIKDFLIEQNEGISRKQLNQIEAYLDKVFSNLNIDVEFTRHFFDRLNDPRNKKQITVAELIKLFNDQYKRNGQKIAKMKPESEAVLKDLSTKLNSPFVLKYNRRTSMLELVSKTIMRKANFHSPDREFRV